MRLWVLGRHRFPAVRLTTDRLRTARLPAVRWDRVVPVLVVVLVAIGVTAVLVRRSGAGTEGGGGRNRGQIAGTVAIAAAETRQVTATVRLAGSVAATESAAVVAGLAGKVDEVDVKLGDEVTAGQTIAHVSQSGDGTTGAAYQEPSPSGDPPASSTPSPSPAPSTTSPPPHITTTPITPPPTTASPTRTPTSVPPTSRPPTAGPPTSRPPTARPPASRPPNTSPGTPPRAPASTQNPRAQQPNPPPVPQITIQPPDIVLPSGPTEQTLTAPFDGKITQLGVVDGSPVSSGTVVATVAGSGLEVQAGASPAQAAQLAGKTGAKATVRPAVPGSSTQIDATVSSTGPTANATTQQTPVVLTFNGGTGAVKPGDPVSVDVQLPGGEGVVVPAEAVVFPDGKPAVFVVKDQIDPALLGIALPANLPEGLKVGRVTQTPVELGIRSGDAQQITHGLDAGADVVVSGQTNLIDGARVAILADPDASASADPATSDPTPAVTATR